MIQYTIRRLLMMIPTLLAVSILVFVIMRVIPGDVALLMLGGDPGVVDPNQLAFVRDKLGLNDPIMVQFGKWLWAALQLDFGTSFYTGEPVFSEIAHKLPLTAEIAILATTLAFVLGIPLGVMTAIMQDRWPDYIIRVTTLTGMAVPSFWTGIVMIVFLVSFFNWSPPLGYISIFDRPWENLQIVIWPVIAVGIRQTAVGIRMTRASMLEVMRQDYVNTAWAKGLHARQVIMIHALKNSVLPVITLLGMEFAVLFGGLIVTETVFAVPGLGRFVVQSVTRRDFPLVQAIVLSIALFVMVINLFVDLSYAWLDPRIKYN